VPLPPADSLGFRFNHRYEGYGSGSRVFITDGRPEGFYVIGSAVVRGDLEQDVPVERSVFAPRSPAWAVRWWHANAAARYLQRAAFRQRNAEVFLKASRLKRSVRGGAVTVVGDGDVRDPEVERWLQRAYGLPIGTPLYLCAPSSGAVMTLRLGYRDPNGPIDQGPRGFELQFRHRGKTQYPNEFTPIRLDVQTGRLLVYRRENPSGTPSGNPYLVLDPSGQPGQGGTLTSANFGAFRASSCPAQ
jgi:hypothetical protein